MRRLLTLLVQAPRRLPTRLLQCTAAMQSLLMSG